MTAQRDLRSDLEVENAFNQAIASDTTTASTFILDTADYDNGVVFAFAAQVWASGSFEPKLEHSDDSGMAGAVDVPAANIIGSIVNATLDAATVEGAAMPSLGVVGVKRYVRVSIVSTGTADATIVVTAIKMPELLPAVEPDA